MVAQHNSDFGQDLSAYLARLGRDLGADLRWPGWPLFLRRIAIGVFGLVAGALLWLYFLDWNAMRAPLSRYLSHRMGHEVRIAGDLKVHLFSWTPSASVGGLTVANPPGMAEPYAADVGHLALSARLMPLVFQGRLILPSVEIDDPDVLVRRDATGRTNWDMHSDAYSWSLPPINRFIVTNGHIAIDDRVRRMTFTGTVNSHEQADAGDRAFELSGAGTLNGNKFLADVHGGALIHVDETKPYDFSADIRSGTTHVVADGHLTRPFHLNSFWATTTFSGPSMADLYYLTGLVFPSTPPYRLSGTVTRDGAIYRFTNLAGIVGESDLHGAMDVDTAQTPTFLRARFASKQLRFVDLGPFIGAPPVKAQTPGLPAPEVTPAAQKHVLPDAPLRVERVRAMNADVIYDADTIKSQDFPLRTLHLHLLLNDGVMTIDPITFDFSKGKLSGKARIDARKQVAVNDVDARLTNIRVEQFVKGNPPPLEGLLEARARLHAVGNSVHDAAANANGGVTFVVPDGKMRKAFAELTGINVLNGLGLMLADDKSDTQMRCAVAKFDATNGRLTSEQVVLDTEPVLIKGQGTVDMKDETMDLTVTGSPKHFRIGRVRAPITISGPIDHPSLGVKASAALGQGGIGAALGLINPFAAILAFVDPGLAKDANCAALAQDAHSGRAPVGLLKAKH
jgi:AsmA family protein